jgi:hypothetical protein
MADIRRRARQTVIERYDLRGVCLPRHVALVDALAAGRLPPDLEADMPSAQGLDRALPHAVAYP